MHTDNTQSHPRRRHVREQRKSKAPGDRARPASGPARRAGFALGLSLSPRLTARGVTVRNPGPITPASPHTGRPRPAGADPLRWTPPRGGAGAAHAPPAPRACQVWLCVMAFGRNYSGRKKRVSGKEEEQEENRNLSVPSAVMTYCVHWVAPRFSMPYAGGWRHTGQKEFPHSYLWRC